MNIRFDKAINLNIELVSLYKERIASHWSGGKDSVKILTAGNQIRTLET